MIIFLAILIMTMISQFYIVSNMVGTGYIFLYIRIIPYKASSFFKLIKRNNFINLITQKDINRRNNLHRKQSVQIYLFRDRRMLVT